MRDDQLARITQIQLRPGVTVRVWDLPHDLTTAEAEKITAVVQALAHPKTNGEAGGG